MVVGLPTNKRKNIEKGMLKKQQQVMDWCKKQEAGEDEYGNHWNF